MESRYARRFGALVHLHRTNMGFTQEQLANEMSYASHTGISQIETGTVKAPFEMVFQLAAFLNIDLNKLIDFQPAPPAAAEETGTTIVKVTPNVDAHIHLTYRKSSGDGATPGGGTEEASVFVSQSLPVDVFARLLEKLETLGQTVEGLRTDLHELRQEVRPPGGRVEGEGGQVVSLRPAGQSD